MPFKKSKPLPEDEALRTLIEHCKKNPSLYQLGQVGDDFFRVRYCDEEREIDLDIHIQRAGDRIVYYVAVTGDANDITPEAINEVLQKNLDPNEPWISFPSGRSIIARCDKSAKVLEKQHILNFNAAISSLILYIEDLPDDFYK